MSLDHKLPPPLVGAVIALAMWLAAPLGPALPLDDGLRHAIAGALVATGVAFDLSGLLAFRSARTIFNPLAPERASALVTRGVYRITRNPMYVGMLFLLLAGAVWLSSGVAFAGPVAFVLFITRFQIQPEERALARLFGEPYAAYCARVRRWF